MAALTADRLRERLFDAGYVADEEVGALLWMSLELERPILIEGEAGVGKTALASACAGVLDRPLLRLQCYEGLDLNQALYEWNYGRQLLEIRLAESANRDSAALREDLFSERFLLQRPLLQAIRSNVPAVLLIDEIDRADEAFEAFLLEMLAEYQVSIPELGTLTAVTRPLILITSNGTRELSDALRRRCLYHFLDYPSAAREIQILHARVPDASAHLIEQAVTFVQRLRREDLDKTPGIAETVDWVRALFRLGHAQVPDDPHAIVATLSTLLKTRDDRWQINPDRVRKLLEGAKIGQDSGVAADLK